MKNVMILWTLTILLIAFLMWLPMITISKELLDLNLDLSAEDEVVE